MKNTIRLVIFILFVGFMSVAQAVQPDEILPDANLEARAREISSHLRCLVCQNESIDDSNAPLARDLRMLVRERLSEGDSNQKAIDYIVARYGEYVLLKPRFEGSTILLWLSPILILLAAFAYILYNFRQKKPSQQVELTVEEKRRLQRILDE
ncbi:MULTISPECIES: cytochrome c-type biogenesis protein [unclassified Bartonella]|uniref:cytochrome c-type biogenesis protein n=1 Tax=unclassified Bartonella TaxID=2645622 RepID=UPI0015FDB156|nr:MULTISPECIES: cytochrome c-type biogenesis protein [unclassified Bartonella]UXN07729.1 cytochrome c-type biogenesis protein CcmH [Bartonella sp. HY761]